MALPPLSIILNNAPLIIQGANKLLKMVRDKSKENEQEHEPAETPTTVDGLKEELKRINERLDNNNNSNIQQIELIEALAKQNETMANSLQSSNKRQNVISIIAVAALLLALVCLAWIITH